MALEHITTVRNTLCNNVVDLLDSGHLVIALANDTAVATIDLSATAFGAAATGTAAMLDTPLSDTSAVGNASDVAIFIVQDSAPAEVFRGAVAVSGSDLNLSSLSIANGDTVTISSFTYSSSV